MATVRDFLGTFCVAAVVLMAFVSFVFMGSALMNEFVTLADLSDEFFASAVLAVILAIPMAAVGSSSRHFHTIGTHAA